VNKRAYQDLSRVSANPKEIRQQVFRDLYYELDQAAGMFILHHSQQILQNPGVKFI